MRLISFARVNNWLQHKPLRLISVRMKAKRWKQLSRMEAKPLINLRLEAKPLISLRMKAKRWKELGRQLKVHKEGQINKFLQ